MEPNDYILLSLLWIAYCAVHSLLISITVTNYLKQILGGRYRFYRLFFNIFSLATLIPLLIFSHSARWGAELLFTWGGTMRIVQYGLIALAATLVLTSLRNYRVLEFAGIQQILGKKPGGAMTAKGELLTNGILGVVRHPWYLAVFILLWAGDLNLADLTINIVLSGYLVVGAFLEERKLILEFGEDYRLYQRQVSMFIPLKWLKSKLHRYQESFISLENPE